MIKTLFKDAWALYRKHMYVLLGVSVLPVIPSMIIQNKITSLSDGVPPAMLGAIFGGNFVAATLLLVANLFVYFMLGQSVMGQDTRFKAVAQILRDRLGLGLKVVLYMALKVMTGFLLAIIPGIIWSMRYWFVPLAITTESREINALALSTKLMKKYLWPISGLYFLGGLLIAPAMILTVLAKESGATLVLVAAIISAGASSFLLPMHYVIFKRYRDKIMAENPLSEYETPYVTWKMVFTWAGALIGMLVVWFAVIELVTK